MKKKILTAVAAITTALGSGGIYNEYQNGRLPEAEQRISEDLKQSFEYEYKGYTVKIKSHKAKGSVVWIEMEARKGSKPLDLDTPYGYANINILRGDDRELAFKDMIHSTIVMQDKPEFQAKFKKIKEDRKLRKLKKSQ